MERNNQRRLASGEELPVHQLPAGKRTSGGVVRAGLSAENTWGLAATPYCSKYACDLLACFPVLD